VEPTLVLGYAYLHSEVTSSKFFPNLNRLMGLPTFRSRHSTHFSHKSCPVDLVQVWAVTM